MAFLSRDELIKKYKAGSLTSADLQENGITMSQVKYLAEEDEREKMERERHNSERHNMIKDSRMNPDDDMHNKMNHDDYMDNKMNHDDDMESEEDKI